MGSDRNKWYERAACQGKPLSAFFGYEGERMGVKRAREREAKAICATCPVITECLDFAIGPPKESGERYGVWGGMNPEARAYEKRNRPRRIQRDEEAA